MNSIGFIVIWNLVVDIYFFYTVFKFAALEETEDHNPTGYKIVAILTFIFITSPYWIAYSALVTILH